MIKRFTLAIAMLALLSACNTTLLPANLTPDVPLTNSVEQAERKLEEARIERAAVEARFSAAEQVCYARFFVNDCLDEAKEKRRSALAYLRAVEVEAEYYQRKSTADQRDHELAEAQKAFDAEEARRAAEPAAPPAPPAAESAPAPRKPARAARKDSPASRQAAAAERERLEAPQRAANVAAYQKKQEEVAARQRAVAEKLAKRQAKQQSKAAAAAVPAPAAAPASAPK